jgi:two-component system CheB/CheR fusion protein
MAFPVAVRVGDCLTKSWRSIELDAARAMMGTNKQQKKKKKTKAISSRKSPLPKPVRKASRATSASLNGSTKRTMPVVGICASAGGLDAFKKFFAAMPPESGMAFILIPHLDPNQESFLADLLKRWTTMVVVEATDGISVAENRVYVIPPNKYLQIRAGRLRLTGPIERKGPLAFDGFLRSLAEDQAEKAVGIILSGTGAYGTQGLRAIKAHGGLVMVQDPQTAEYDSMPRSAIATGLVDCVLPVSKMPKELLHLSRSYVQALRQSSTSEDAGQQLSAILTLILANTGHDFRRYRKRTLLRRIERRMCLKRVNQLRDYRPFLIKRPEEVNQLVKDLLINVTTFLRDPEAFQALEREVIPELLIRKTDGEVIRAWVPGCATGEEAYSIAILLLEGIEAARRNCGVRVFATDLNEAALETAREGIYADSIADHLSTERLARFFVRLDEHRFQASKQLRDCITFAVQNVLSDAPFSKLDLISCRNLLIYIEPEVQQNLLLLFHFALVDRGYLFLGPSETIGRQTDWFESVSKRWRIYRRIWSSRLKRLAFPQGLPSARMGLPAASSSPVDLAELNLRAIMQRELLGHYAPAAVLVSRAEEILYYHGQTSLYLQQPAGEPTRGLIAMTREGLRVKLRTALHQAIRNEAQAIATGGRVKRVGGYLSVRITVTPVTCSHSPEKLLLVIFDEDPAAAPPATEGDIDKGIAHEFEDELRGTREELQVTIEDMEGINERLKASNEEVMSMNEELQATNEELETSKEELQSLNEELTTLNGQLQENILELGIINDDIANLLDATEHAAIFLGTGLRIRRFTPSSTDMMNLIATDVGRPISSIKMKIDDPELLNDTHKVLRGLTPINREVRTEDGRWHLRRVLPYRTADRRIDGVVITFADITLLKQLNDALEVKVAERTKALSESEERFRIMANGTPVPIWVIDPEGHIEFVNRAYCEFFGTTLDAVRSEALQTIIHPDDAAEYNAAFELAARDHQSFSAQARVRRYDGHWRWIVTYSQPRISSSGEFLGMAGSNPDITERMEMEESLRERELRLSAILNTATDAIVTIDNLGRIDSVNPATERIFGYTAAELIGCNVSLLMPSPYREEHDRYLEDYQKTGISHILNRSREVTARRKDGTKFPVDLAVSKLGPLPMFTGILRDISSRKNLEREVVEIALLEQQRVGRELHDECGQELAGMSLMANHLLQSLANDATADLAIAKKVLQGIDRLMRFVRNTAHGLAQTEITPAELPSALAQLASRLDDPSGRRCVAECDGLLALEDEIKATHLYHIAQEACTNAIKHSHARNVHIRVRSGANAVVLQVDDDGVGIGDSIAGFGTRIMRNRASVIQAELTIEPLKPHGTRVTCSVPTNPRLGN